MSSPSSGVASRSATKRFDYVGRRHRPLAGGRAQPGGEVRTSRPGRSPAAPKKERLGHGLESVNYFRVLPVRRVTVWGASVVPSGSGRNIDDQAPSRSESQEPSERESRASMPGSSSKLAPPTCTDCKSGSVAHGGEELAEGLVADGDGLCAGDRVFALDVGDGLAEALGEGLGRQGAGARLAEQAERRVEGDEGFGHHRDGAWGDLRPVLLRPGRCQG